MNKNKKDNVKIVNENKLKTIDEKIADYTLIYSYYSIMNIMLVSLTKCGLPKTYKHPLVDIYNLSIENEKIHKLSNKRVSSKIKKFIEGKGKICANDIIPDLTNAAKSLKEKLDTLVDKRLH